MARFDLKSLFRVRRMKVGQKCALIAVPFVFPIAALLYTVFSQNNENTAVVSAELKGLEYLRPTKSLSLQLAEHRVLNQRVAQGDRSAEAERVKVARQIDATFRELEAVDAKDGAAFKTTEKWSAARESWVMINRDLRSQRSYQLHTELIALVLDIVSDVWEYSTLALDPVADTYYLQDLMIARGITGMEDIAQLRDLATGGASAEGDRAPFAEAEKIQANILLGAIESTKLAFEKETKSAIRANPKLKGSLDRFAAEYRATVDAFVAVVQALLLDHTGIRPTPGELNTRGAAAIASLNKLYDGFDPLLVDLLTHRAEGYRNANVIASSGTVLALIFVALAAWLVTTGITRQVRNLTALFQHIEAGDYSQRAEPLSEDELGALTRGINKTLDHTLSLIQSSEEKEQIQSNIMKLLAEVGGVADGDLTKDAEVSADLTGAIADSFNYMIEHLRNVIGNVQVATVNLSTAASQIHDSTKQLASETENPSEEIVHTLASVDSLAKLVDSLRESISTFKLPAEVDLRSEDSNRYILAR